MSTREPPTSVGVPATAAPAAHGRRLGSGFVPVAFAFLIVAAFATLPSPLYGLYRIRDDLTAFTITIVYAIFAAGTIAALISVRYVAARIGRRGVMLTAVTTMIFAATILVVWKALPGLLTGRLITGLAVGLVAGTATTYLIELRLRADPKASLIRARNIATAVNVGALGVGPLIAGCLAEWVRWPLTVPYLVFIALGVASLVGVASAPETARPSLEAVAAGSEGKRPRTPRILAPGAVATMAAFAANGLFAGLSGLFLVEVFGHTSHALAGFSLFLVFSCGVAAQMATNGLPAARVLQLGTLSMVSGLILLVVSVQLSTPSLGMFLGGGALIGGGAGAVFKGTTGLVLEVTPAEDRLAVTSDLLIALFAGISIPVLGAGIALDQGVTPATTVLAFAIAVGIGVVGAGAWLQRSLR